MVNISFSWKIAARQPLIQYRWPGQKVGILSCQRRRIKTEEKAKVVVAIWGTELIQFLAAL